MMQAVVMVETYQTVSNICVIVFLCVYFFVDKCLFPNYIYNVQIINNKKKNKIITNKKQLGRPVNENSVRQIRLKEIAEKRAQGLIKRGRPANENSKNAQDFWFVRLDGCGYSSFDNRRPSAQGFAGQELVVFGRHQATRHKRQPSPWRRHVNRVPG